MSRPSPARTSVLPLLAALGLLGAVSSLAACTTRETANLASNPPASPYNPPPPSAPLGLAAPTPAPSTYATATPAVSSPAVPVAAAAEPPATVESSFAKAGVARDDEDRAGPARELDAPGRAASGSAAASSPAPLARASHRSAPVSDSLSASDGAYAATSIAAGEWDDNANYREFQKWLATEKGIPFRAVDVSHRRFLVVRDESGRAVPGCAIEVSDAAKRSVTLVTGPSGRAILFPNAEGIGEGLVTATATCNGTSVTRPVSLAASDGVVDLRLPVARQLPAERTIDVAFILDTTGSMSEEIASVKATIAKVASGLGENGQRRGNVNVRIGLVEYKDRGDTFVTRVHPFANDVKGFARSVADISAGGGGDTPESVNEGIHVALTRLDWRDSSVGRFAFLVGDAPPHLDYNQDFSYAADMKTAAHRGIQLFTIAASGMDPLGQVVWRQIAQYTNAANMFVLRGGAGPQSVGAGDPRSSCGGTQKNYSSGNLDALILGKIDGELAALDADPLRIAGLGEDENTKPCDQRVVMVDPRQR